MSIPAGFYFDLMAKAQRGEIEGQVKTPPSYWITVTMGGAGYFAVMMWDGGGFPEPWQSGDGRYRTREQAEREAKDWAEAEELEYLP